MVKAEVHISNLNGTTTVILSGDWTKNSVAVLSKPFETLTCKEKMTCIFDFSQISDFDTHGIMLIFAPYETDRSVGLPCLKSRSKRPFWKIMGYL